MKLTAEQKAMILRVARDAITAVIRDEEPELQTDLGSLGLEPMGIFVTLHKAGDLRGCIGYIEGIKPFAEAVPEMAVTAATRDPRFPPVRSDELDRIDLEISILSPLRKIESEDEVEVGVHGLVIQQGFMKGLLLPQVATEYGWNRVTFLEHACMKAGLAPDAWKSQDTEISVFEAEVFGEKDIGGGER